MKRTISWLSCLIALLSVFAAGTALFYRTPDTARQFTSLHGESIPLQGHGLYQLDSKSAAAQGLAQDMVTLVLAVPFLLGALAGFNRGSLRATLFLAGVLGYFLYTYVSDTFLFQFNPLFLVYVALYSMSLFALILVLRSLDPAELVRRIGEKFPVKTSIGFFLLIGLMLALLWLGRVLPGLKPLGTPAGLEHYTTLVIQAMDLGLVVPLALLTAYLLWRRQAWGYLLSAVVMVKGLTLSLAIDAMIVNSYWAGLPVSPVEVFFFGGLSVFSVFLTWRIFTQIKA